MKEQKLQLFVDIVKHYFTQFSDEELIVETPYLLEDKLPRMLDYTGLIGISGEKKGVVYFTASRQMLDCILDSMGETDKSEANYVDLAGEVANTISGNARKEFGGGFHISVPIVFKGMSDTVVLPKDERSFIIPIRWQSQAGEIVICLED